MSTRVLPHSIRLLLNLNQAPQTVITSGAQRPFSQSIPQYNERDALLHESILPLLQTRNSQAQYLNNTD